MNGLQGLATSYATWALAAGLYIISFGVRRLVEAWYPPLSSTTPPTRSQRIWEQWALPLMPAMLGLAFCAAASPDMFPYPSVAAGSILSRMTYGLLCGWGASGLYRNIKAVVKKKWDVSLPDDSIPPRNGGEVVPIIPPNPAPKVDPVGGGPNAA